MSWTSPPFDNLLGCTFYLRCIIESWNSATILVRKAGKLAIAYFDGVLDLYALWDGSPYWHVPLPPSNVPVTICVSYSWSSTNNDPIVLYNGVLQTATRSSSTPTGNPAMEGATTLTLGCHDTADGVAANHLPATVLDCGFAGYAMSLAEMQALTAQPYGMFDSGMPLAVGGSAVPTILEQLEAAV